MFKSRNLDLNSQFLLTINTTLIWTLDLCWADLLLIIFNSGLKKINLNCLGFDSTI